MHLKLSFAPRPPAERLHYKKPFLFTGSCFSEHIASRMSDHFFDVVSQPNGVVFNPLSIALHLQRIIAGKKYTGDELFLFRELWHSWQHHGSFNGTVRSEVLNAMNDKLEQASRQVSRASCTVIVTLGTAWGYALRTDEKNMTANCHKYPQQEFIKRLLSKDEIVQAFGQVIPRLPQVYFTVSPVRHVRDGLVENNVSKGILLQAVYELCQRFPNCYYFPAYEIVTDELRDYRFYEPDLVHPNALAVEYVWQAFMNTCFDEETKAFANEAFELKQLLGHRVLHQHTEASRRFEEVRGQKLDAFQSKYGVSAKPIG